MTTLRFGPVSAVVRWRQVAVPLAAAVLLVLLSAVSLGRGDFPIGLADVLRALVGLGEETESFIVLQLRAPRILIGLLVGVALGLAASLAMSNVVRAMLFQIEPVDSVSYAFTAAVLVVIAALACYIPARRATKVDPIVALRQS